MFSEHFSNDELKCHCGCGRNECTQELVDALEAFRAVATKPVIVDDAYRCPSHNAAVGGVAHSQHEQGTAADVRVEGMTAVQLEAAARCVAAIRGIGRADHQDYLHVDVRSAPARWCYDARGREIPYYDPEAARNEVVE